MNLQNLTLQQLKVEYNNIHTKIEQNQKKLDEICDKMNQESSLLINEKLKISIEIDKRERDYASNKSESEILQYFFNECKNITDANFNTVLNFRDWVSQQYQLDLIGTPFNTYTIGILYHINDLHFTFVNDQINHINKILPYIQPVPNDCHYFNNRLHGTKIIQLRVAGENVFKYWISISPHDNFCTVVTERTWNDKKLFTFSDHAKTLNDTIINFVNTFYV